MPDSAPNTDPAPQAPAAEAPAPQEPAVAPAAQVTPEAPAAPATTPPATPATPATPETPKDLTKDPGVQAYIREQTEKAARAAHARGVKEASDKAAQELERSKMDAVERLKAEHADKDAEIARLQTQITTSAQQQAFTDALIGSGHQLAGGNSAQFLRAAVNDAVSANPDLSMEQAITEVLAANPYLVKAAPQEPAAAPATLPSTTPTAGQPAPAAPAKPKPAPAVDTLNMTRAEYQKHKREIHGLGQ